MKLYQQKDWLYQKYIVENKSTAEIAVIVKVVHTTILNWLERFSISRRPPSQGLLGKTGKKHPRWKGGERLCNGYIKIKKPEHPNADNMGYVKRGNLIMEEKLGRYLKKEELVHHINNERDDDRPENLILFSTTGKHTAHHNRIRKETF